LLGGKEARDCESKSTRGERDMQPLTQILLAFLSSQFPIPNLPATCRQFAHTTASAYAAIRDSVGGCG
jgi:hypothetical protein